MFRFKASVRKRAETRRLKRHDRRKNLINIIVDKNGIETDDDNESSEEENEHQNSESINIPTNPIIHSNALNEVNYQNDDFDDVHLDNQPCTLETDTFLFDGNAISVHEAVRKLTSFFIDFNLNKNAAIRLLHIVKEILPQPNRLPTTWKSITKILGHISSSSKNFLCPHCFQRCDKGAQGRKICRNDRCSWANQIIKDARLIEVVHMNIRSQIQSILRSNKNLLNRTDLYPRTDVCFGTHYRNLPGRSINRITLIVHTDGAPLVKLSKQNLWPCFASLVELPPPVREYQRNMIVLALWSSNMKPDPNVFLNETVNELKNLIKNCTSIFIDGKEFEINLRTQCFVSDLPAKSLFCRTINFNGYSACTECRSTGMCSDKIF